MAVSRICFIFTPIWGRFPICLIFFRWVETTNQLIILNGTHFGGKITVPTCLFGETTIIYYLFFCLGKKCVFLHFCCLGKRIVDMILFRENDC